MSTNSNPVPLGELMKATLADLELAQAVRDLRDVHGWRRAAQLLDLSLESTRALAFGAPTQRGTKAQARARLAELATIGKGAA